MGDPVSPHRGMISNRSAATALSRRAILAGMLAPLAGGILPAHHAPAQSAPRRFVYDDLNRYIAAVRAINGGAAPAAVLQAYLDGASDGLKTWLTIYPATADELASELGLDPAYHASLASSPRRIAALEPEISRAYARLEAIVPGADLGDVYFLVGKGSAGGTARPQGTFVAVEMFGRTDQTLSPETGTRPASYGLNELVQVVVHEGVHNLQRHVQGEPNFISIYVNPERMTLLNFAVREGVADYVTHHLTGRWFEPRHAFAEPREAEIWAEFRPIMTETIMARPGWFTGRFADGRGWPIQVGYFVGFKMAEHIHRNAADGSAALFELMSPHTDAQFRAVADRYAQKFA